MTRFFVPGVPVTQGSKRAAVKRGRAVMWEDRAAALKPWRDAITWHARAARVQIPTGTPVAVELEFVLPRPRGHYGTGRNRGQLRPSAPTRPAVKPDVDKLARAALDALTASGIYHDDAQVAALYVTKVYATRGGPGVWIGVEELPTQRKDTP